MEDVVHLIKTAGPKMVPFMKAVIIYFMLVTFDAKGEVWTTILKCAPIVCLMLFIAFYGFSFLKQHSYSQKILFGLIFSCIGDALLNMNLFPHGMGAFALAQICYISAFGFKPIKFWIGLVLYVIGVLFVFLIYDGLDKVLTVGLPVYACLLTTMCWRAVVQATSSSRDKYRLAKLICAFGSILFVISDGFIAIDKFYVNIPNSRIYIMTTYYAAQFAITLSIASQHNDKSDSSKRDDVKKNAIRKVKKTN